MISSSRWNLLVWLLCLGPLSMGSVGVCRAQVTIDHHWSNTDAQSLIGLPMGSHKTILDKDGNLKWSQWNLKRRPLDSPIGFSSQMDGELAIEALAGAARLTVSGQQLYRGRYPFIVSTLHGADVTLEELAFAVDPDATPNELPNRNSGGIGMDMVRLQLRNESALLVNATLKISGKERNLPARVVARTLVTGSGEEVALLKELAAARYCRVKTMECR